MPLEAENVESGFEMLKGKAISSSEAARLAALFGDRQELLAYLILRERAFANWPEVTAALRATALAVYVAPRTPRTEHGDGVGPQLAAVNAWRAMDELLASERARTAVAEAAHDAIGQVVSAWVEAKTHPGYHWCVRNELQS